MTDDATMKARTRLWGLRYVADWPSVQFSKFARDVAAGEVIYALIVAAVVVPSAIWPYRWARWLAGGLVLLLLARRIYEAYRTGVLLRSTIDKAIERHGRGETE